MKLEDLVNYFRNGGSYEFFCQSQSLDKEAEVVEIYMEKPFFLNNEIKFFEIERTGGRLEFFYNGITYHNLFDFYYFLDAIEESNNKANQSFTDNEIANKLLAYAINDA